ncbi:LA_3751/LA_3752 family putative glycosyltransferase [Leptospira jelokensis]|uniref:LA_3751/LA_3752 family putative glycosyltransferase n=1 Tax=Leptospira jelokensis TaxID=2484931 RepID=UPI0010911BEA|nr:hypothetical protein [Leptospira jelokensis]TGL99250.1 hypothetical protein EHQ79_15675 [Leptospira jelokensis]
MSFSKRFSIYLLIVFLPFFYRYQWNHNSIFISSDPEIKYYQVIHSLEGGSPSECYFPAEKLGFNLSFIPFGYPWAFNLKSGNCVFQYPVLFTWIQKGIVWFTSIQVITYIPILFFLFNFVLLDRIFTKQKLNDTMILFAVIIVQCFTPIFLSSLDYSELTLTNFFLLLVIYLFHNTDTKFPKMSDCILSLAIVLNFQLRPESTIALVIYFSIYLLLHENRNQFIRRMIPIALYAIVFQGIFCIYNYDIYGHILGMRGLNTMNDMSSADLQKDLFGGFIADLWGNEFKIGIFKGYPILFLTILCIFIERNKTRLLYLLSGILFFLFLPFISPYRAGVDIFGMRYFESGVYLAMIGFFLTVTNHKKIRYFLILSLFLLYFSYKSDGRAIKQWSSSAKMYQQVMGEFDALRPDLIVHRGLSLSYLIGQSYIQYPQIAIYSNSDWEKVESIARNQNWKILFLEWEGNQLVSNEFPKKIWKEKFDINFNLSPKAYTVVSNHRIAHFNGYLLEEKK